MHTHFPLRPMIALCGILFLDAGLRAVPIVTNDAVSKIVTMSSGTGAFVLKLDYNAKARVTSFLVNGTEVFDQTATEGIYSALRIGGTWYTSQSLAASPGVAIAGTNPVTVTVTGIATALSTETWTFTVTDPNIQLQVSRTYNASYVLDEKATPMVSFAEHAWDDIRTHGDGGSLPVDSTALNTYQQVWIATGSQLNTAFRVAKEQVDYTLLREDAGCALTISGVSNHDGLVARPKATEFYRSDATKKNLRLLISTSDDAAHYAGGLTGLQYPSASKFGYSRNHTTVTGESPLAYKNSVYEQQGVTTSTTDVVTLTFTPDTYANYYDVGTLKGVDQYAISRALHIYGRTMMIDAGLGALFEGGPKHAQVAPLEQHYVGQLLEVLADDGNLAAYRGGLQNIKDYLQVQPSGEIGCCWPGMGIGGWGMGRPDQPAGYALAVVKAYALTGDLNWLKVNRSGAANNTMAESVRQALDYAVANQMDATSRKVKFASPVADCANCGVYWEVTSGAYSGYGSALMYEALRAWAALEADPAVLNDTTHAATYNGVADTLKTSFNAAKGTGDTGGFWSSSNNTFYNASGNNNTPFLPTVAAVLRANISTDRTRAAAVANTFETDTTNRQHDVHAMNHAAMGYANEPALSTSQSLFQNGGWYGLADGDFFAAFPLLNKPHKIPVYVAAFTNRFYYDGFYNDYGAYDVYNTFGNGYWNTGFGFAGQVMPLWGLYHYGYGFQPRYNELLLAPFVSPAMCGSIVKYQWRRQPLTVTYVTQKKFTVTSASLATALRIRWINQTPSGVYQVAVDGGAANNVTADADGNVDWVTTATGTHTYECTNATVIGNASGSTSWVTATNLGDGTKFTGSKDYGMRFVVGANPITVTELGRWYQSPTPGPRNTRTHLLKIFDSTSGNCVAQAVVNCADGGSQAGYVYGALPAPGVTLAANGHYAFVSTEVTGGDYVYDVQCSVTTTSAASVEGTYKGLKNGGSVPWSYTASPGHTYGPLNFKYNP